MVTGCANFSKHFILFVGNLTQNLQNYQESEDQEKYLEFVSVTFLTKVLLK